MKSSYQLNSSDRRSRRGSAKRLLTVAVMVCDLLAGRRVWAGVALHPLGEPLADAAIELRLHLPQAGVASVPVVCVYRARRQWDVKTRFHFHVLDSPWRSASTDWFGIERSPSHEVRQEQPLADGNLSMRVPLRDPDADYAHYQLAEIRLPGVDFGAWSAQAPQLPAGFGLTVSADGLGGKVETEGLAAEPLGGRLPLWPALRRVELTLASRPLPAVGLWDGAAKAYADGWRSSRRETWSGGRWQIFRRNGDDTVYRALEWLPQAPGDQITSAQTTQALPGIALEVFWPRGDKLTLDGVSFAGDLELLALPLASLSEHLRAMLAAAALPRPGMPAGVLNAEEWREFEAVAAPTDRAAQIRLAADQDGQAVVTVRRKALDQAWLYLFASRYGRESRVAFSALVLHPNAWIGPLPE